MVSTPRSRRLGVAAVASVAALGLGLSAPGHATAGPQPHPLSGKVPAKKPDQSVTLITGDRVVLRGGNPAEAAVRPGAGRQHVAFSTYRQKGHFYVVPADVRQQVSGGKLDARLFDVTELIKDGYDDKSSSTLPVIVTYTGKAQKRSAVPGAKLTRQLPVVNGAALKLAKGHSLTGGSGIDKIWLDGKSKVTLDQSVPQIGAPTAWQAGYTGKSVPIAVLDSGIDASHPDLATQVVARKNFTDSPDGDHFGHGTHVASIIAGTAAASNGKYKGVAPDARLYDGKVCDDGGSCSDSSVLGGMEWAAKEVKAKVVNMSFGRTDTPGIDPLEEAVNRLTAETGTLFVVAAGNDGPGDGTVGSPGSADAALTVGSVDKQNQLAYDSSRGPRVGDGALKPDVTAPGVSIVAAKAKDSVIGEPVGEYYLRLSGTSMATPHTAGAAAILAQEHPNWKASELKSVLMASAKPAAGQTAFQQGAGRIDVARGIKQTVFAEPGNVSFGTAVWPHSDDTPVTKTLTYRNVGDQPVTLNLAATFNAPDGSPAPAGAFQLSATTVTVPAGGTASVQATSNTNNNGPDGPYSGRITATSGDTQVTSAVGVNKEPESYNLTLKAIGPDGQPAPAVGLLDSLDGKLFEFFGDGSDSVTYRLTKGEYLAQLTQFIELPGSKYKVYDQVHPDIKLTKDTTVVFDARKAKRVKVTVPQAGAQIAAADIGFDRVNSAGTYSLSSGTGLRDFGNVFIGQLGPALPPAQLTGHVTSQWAQPNADGTFDRSPYVSGQANSFPGVYPSGFVRAVKVKDQATVRQTTNATGDRGFWRIALGRAPGMTSTFSPILEYGKGPLRTTLYADQGPAVWQTEVREIIPSIDPNNPFPRFVTQLTTPDRTYRGGSSYREVLNAAAFTMAPWYAARAGNALAVQTYNLAAATGERGFTATDAESSKLIRDGKVVAESPFFGDVYAEDLAPEKATYTLVSTQTRQSFSTFSTRMDLRWTFSSGSTADETKLPMLGIRYQPAVDSHNVADRKPVTVLPVVIDAQDGATVPRIKKLTVQVSGDDGTSWHDAGVVATGAGTFKAIFATPKGANAVSLKAHLVDAGGNVTDLTTIGAYPLR
ncbi:S8 family serine peptidase [Kribbella sp. NPDC026611]|uniref:S8 family serine peptidase n=1 Tax=Kribbella sp. NPDC026611 TaxID=3154911 RepID=UPI003403E8A8